MWSVSEDGLELSGATWYVGARILQTAGVWFQVHTLPATGNPHLTFGAVIVPVKVAVLWLPLPPHNVVTEVAVGQGRRVPLYDELGRGVGCGENIQGNGRNWKGEHRPFQKMERTLNPGGHWITESL